MYPSDRGQLTELLKTEFQEVGTHPAAAVAVVAEELLLVLAPYPGFFARTFAFKNGGTST